MTTAASCGASSNIHWQTELLLLASVITTIIIPWSPTCFNLLTDWIINSRPNLCICSLVALAHPNILAWRPCVRSLFTFCICMLLYIAYCNCHVERLYARGFRIPGNLEQCAVVHDILPYSACDTICTFEWTCPVLLCDVCVRLKEMSTCTYKASSFQLRTWKLCLAMPPRWTTARS